MVVDFAERLAQRRADEGAAPRDVSELERDLLASLLFDGSQYPDVADLGPEVLGDPAIRTAFEALRKAAGKVTPATLRLALERTEPGRWALEALGGEEGLHRLWLEGKAAGKAVALLPPIREAAVEREVLRAFREAPRDRFGDAGEWAAHLAGRVGAAGGLLAPAFDTQGLARGAMAALEAYEWTQDNPGKLRGIRTGMAGVDAGLGGMQPGQLILCGGHALPLSADVMTPFGPKRMGDIHPGDLVSNPDGTVARVLYVAPQGERDTYEVEFADGSVVRCDLDHLWYVFAGNNHRDPKRWPHGQEEIRGRVVTTAELLTMVAKAKARKAAGGSTHWPRTLLTEPVQFTIVRNAPLPVNPYLLGVLLGDGGLSQDSVTFTSADTEIVESVAIAVAPAPLSPHGTYGYTVRDGGRLRADLAKLGLMGKRSHEKFVPETYRVSPLDVRRALIRGLMDTDGYVDAAGRCYFDTTSERLADDVRWILRSLGFAVTRSTKEGAYRDRAGDLVACRTSYRLYIAGPNRQELFSLERKRQRCLTISKRDATTPMLSIIDVRFAGREEAQCIRVDHPNGLFLTDDFVVTHNSNEGKSQVMAFWAWNAVTRLHDLTGEYPAGAYFALEMSEQEMSNRWIALRARVDLRQGYALDDVRARVRKAAGDVAELAERLIVIEAKVASSIDQIVRTLRRLKAERGIAFAVIDYAQLVSPSGKFDSRYEGLGEMARRLKLVAQELGIAVVLGVQLTRGAMERPAGRPTSADIADSHDLFRHADAVFYVWTPYKYVVGELQKPLLGKALILNAKARGGGLAEAEVFEFMPQFTLFAPVRAEVAAEIRRVLDQVAQGQRSQASKRKEAA